jgi:hypothetical protein
MALPAGPPDRQGASDNSVTVCQVMALRAAKEAGFYVQPKVLNDAIKVVKGSFCKEGGFSYMPGGGGGTSYARAGAGAATLQYAGLYECPEVLKTIEWIRKNKQAIGGHDAYGTYYVAQAMFQAGLKNPGYWKDYYQFIKKFLIGKQQGDGQFNLSGDPVFSTGVACIILQIPNRYLPIFER